MRVYLLQFLLVTTLMTTGNSCLAWGFWAHQRINRLAVFTLPPEMVVLYKKNLEFLTEHAVDPDKRRYAVDGEAAHHFIDIDHYGTYPFDNVPRYWDDAVAKFSADTLEAYGVVVYHIPNVVYALKKAFEQQDLVRIMRLSADLGHYVGDSHVPLHTTENYNGQFTGQKGIHGFWESRLPELYGESYDFFVGKAYYVEDIYRECWDAVLESHIALDSVLGFEKQLSETFPADKKYGYESRNAIVIRAYSRDYSQAYHDMLNGQVERRMRMSVLRVGSYWYTAWRLAGSPDLSKLAQQKLEITPKKYKKKLNITDREANIAGNLNLLDCGRGCCGRPSAQAFGMYQRTLSCVQDDPRWALYAEAQWQATDHQPTPPSPKWTDRVWNWIKAWLL